MNFLYQIVQRITSFLPVSEENVEREQVHDTVSTPISTGTQPFHVKLPS